MSHLLPFYSLLRVQEYPENMTSGMSTTTVHGPSKNVRVLFSDCYKILINTFNTYITLLTKPYFYLWIHFWKPFALETSALGSKNFPDLGGAAQILRGFYVVSISRGPKQNFQCFGEAEGIACLRHLKVHGTRYSGAHHWCLSPRM
jgi:hypothetical protein